MSLKPKMCIAVRKEEKEPTHAMSNACYKKNIRIKQDTRHKHSIEPLCRYRNLQHTAFMSYLWRLHRRSYGLACWHATASAEWRGCNNDQREAARFKPTPLKLLWPPVALVLHWYSHRGTRTSHTAALLGPPLDFFSNCIHLLFLRGTLRPPTKRRNWFYI